MLRPLQNLFDPADHPNLLVGLGVPDDAAVYRLSEDQALIFTTDFFTPIVDDPYKYGAIAAANSLSDVYAMGGRPIMALNIAAFPPQPAARHSDRDHSWLCREGARGRGSDRRRPHHQR